MSRSPSHQDQSPDESGYLTYIPRRNTPTSDDYDPSEHDYSDSDRSPERSVTPTLEPTSPATFERESTPVPRRDEAGPSRLRGRRVSPPPSAEIPVSQPAGMTALENYWVSGMAREVERVRMEIDHHEHSIDALMIIMNSSDQILNGLISMVSTGDQTMSGIMRELVETRAMVAWLHTCLSVVMGLLVIVIAWVMMSFFGH
ncbi:hypothetical protein L6452_06185 [Arctium lappa]|uniref:Uncharacterized protein n=1 Tax=Arctium lappa TaxID=4217 RepID=A0ACB9EHV1_ARCLA|nr:hypothetical protein L6452_06185 [Arctium lappa]